MSLSNSFKTANVGRRALQLAFAMSAAGALSVAAAQTATAAPDYSNTFTNQHDCQVAGGQATAAAGGPSKLSFRCDLVSNVPAGVMGCPDTPATQQYGCSVEYYHLNMWHTDGF